MTNTHDDTTPQSVRVELTNQDKELREILKAFSSDKLTGTEYESYDDAILAINHLIAEASIYEIEQAHIVATSEGMTIRYMREALNRRWKELSNLKKGKQE